MQRKGVTEEEVEYLSLAQLGVGIFCSRHFHVLQSAPLIAALNILLVPLKDVFVPVIMMAPPLPPLSNIHSFESNVAEITNLGDKNIKTSQHPMKEAQDYLVLHLRVMVWFLG